MLEPAENADAEPEMNLVPVVDARASSGCLSQKWMLEPEVDAMREQGLGNLPRNGLIKMPVSL